MVFVTLLACNKEDAPDCFQHAGDYKTERRDITSFDLIELRDYIGLELHDTDVYFIEITAPENLIPDISTEISNLRYEIIIAAIGCARIKIKLQCAFTPLNFRK
jgi:hypothetical protein